MVRPPLEVADIIRAAGKSFIDRSHSWLNRLHLEVLNAIERCRTAALGGHVDECTACGHRAISYNYCRNRHCPRCQANARDRWIETRSRDLLPVAYAHVVFTLPHEFAPLALQNKRVVYDLLFRTRRIAKIGSSTAMLTGHSARLSLFDSTPDTAHHLTIENP